MTTKRSALVALTIFLLFANTTLCVSVPVKSEDQDLEFTIKSSVTFSNKGTSIWNLTEEDQSVSLFMNNTWQTVFLTNHSHLIENVTTDEEGNPMAVLRLSKSKIGPNETLSYTVTYRVLSKPRPSIDINEQESGTIDQIPANLREYLGSEGPWLINDTDLKNLANNLTRDETKVLTVVKNFVSWIAEHINYPLSKHEVPYYPNETYRKREGDCDDQAILLITLCRISKIPAYLQIGCIYDSALFRNETYWEGHVRNVQDKIGWHGWAMVYVPPWEWLPVDLTYLWGTPRSQLVNEPFKAIENAAVTSQNVIQYMNVTRTEYVASSLDAKKFLQDNDFYVYVRDEIVRNVDQEWYWSILWEDLLKGVLVAACVTTVIVIFAIYIRRRRTLTPPQEQKVQ